MDATPMTSTPSALRLNAVWRTSFTIYVAHFGKLAAVAAIPHIITALLWGVLRVLTPIGVVNTGSLTQFLKFTNPYAIVGLLLLITITIVTLVGVVALVYTVVKHEEVRFIDAFEQSLHYIPRYIGQAIIVILMSVLGTIVGFVLLLILGIILGKFSIELFTDAFTWLSLIPVLFGIAATVLVIFAQFSIIDKDHGPIAAVKYSMHILRGHFWRVFFALFVLAITTSLLGIALAIIPVIGPLIALLTLTPFALVYMYVLYAGLQGVPATTPATAEAGETSTETSETTTPNTSASNTPATENNSL